MEALVTKARDWMAETIRPRDYRIASARAGQPGYRGRSTDVTVRAGTSATAIVASVRAAGSSVALYANAPAAWAAAVTVQLFAVTGSVRALIVGPVPVLVGATQVFNLPNGIGGADSIELEVLNSPPFVPAVPVGELSLALVTYDQGQAFWDDRFVALLETLDSAVLLLRDLSKKG